MRRDGDRVIVDASDAATLRQIASEFGLTVEQARERIELGPDHAADEMLRFRVAAVYRLALESVR